MKTYYIETLGCQMNKYDSELVAAILENLGFRKTSRIEESDLILLNTCSVRDHAEQRVKNKLNHFSGLKRQRKKGLRIGVLGCMAQRLGQDLIAEKPAIDFVLGPDEYRQLPMILQNIENDVSSSSLSELPFDSYETYSDIYPQRNGSVNAWVAIMRGCNNFCSYCIVPYVRGRERSRSVDSIIQEVRQLVADGYFEVTLLGQNVNSYRDHNTDFADLIYLVSEVPGIKRVRFATSHPKDISEKLIKTIAQQRTICNHFHLPVQSGSNKILQLMNRNYTREHYLSIIKNIREQITDVGLYTDIIVGFPGETEEDFLATYNLAQQVQFDGIFSFMYSPRRGTEAFQRPESVSVEEKQDRLQRLNDMQQEITLNRNMLLVGSVQRIQIEGASRKKKQQQLMGRTESNKIVVFLTESSLSIGSLIDVEIKSAEGHTLFGEIAE